MDFEVAILDFQSLGPEPASDEKASGEKRIWNGGFAMSDVSILSIRGVAEWRSVKDVSRIARHIVLYNLTMVSGKKSSAAKADSMEWER